MPTLTSANLAQFLNKPIEAALCETENALTFLDDYGCNILHFAAHLGKLDTVKYLLEHHPHLDKIAFNTAKSPVLNWTILHFATNEGHRDLVDFLLKKYPDTKNTADALGNNLMHHAARSGKVEVFKSMVQHFGGLDYQVNHEGQNILHRAARSGSADLIYHLFTSYPTQMAIMWVKDKRGHFPDQIEPSCGANGMHPLRDPSLWSKLFNIIILRCANGKISATDKSLLTSFKSPLIALINNDLKLIKSEEMLENMLNLEYFWQLMGDKKMKPLIEVQIILLKLSKETLSIDHIKAVVGILNNAHHPRTYLLTQTPFHVALNGVQTMQDLHSAMGNNAVGALEIAIKALIAEGQLGLSNTDCCCINNARIN